MTMDSEQKVLVEKSPKISSFISNAGLLIALLVLIGFVARELYLNQKEPSAPVPALLQSSGAFSGTPSLDFDHFYFIASTFEKQASLQFNKSLQEEHALRRQLGPAPSAALLVSKVEQPACKTSFIAYAKSCPAAVDDAHLVVGCSLRKELIFKNCFLQ